MREIIGLFIVAVVVYNCSGGGYGTDGIFGPPDSLPLSRYDDLYVNVYFYFPDGKEAYLGRTKGASSCGDMAHGYAHQHRLTGNRNWSYVCCTEEGDSNCYRKIR